MPRRLVIFMYQPRQKRNSMKEMLGRMGHYLDSVFGNKVVIALAAMAAFATALYADIVGEMGTVIGYIVLAVMVLFVGDIILGVMIARRTKTFSSRGFSRSIEKMVVYTLAVVGMTAFGMLVTAVPCASGVVIMPELVGAGARMFFIWTMLLIGLTEFISIIENLRTLGFTLPDNVYKMTEWMRGKLSGTCLTPEEEEDNGTGGAEAAGGEGTGRMDSEGEEWEDNIS